MWPEESEGPILMIPYAFGDSPGFSFDDFKNKSAENWHRTSRTQVVMNAHLETLTFETTSVRAAWRIRIYRFIYIFIYYSLNKRSFRDPGGVVRGLDFVSWAIFCAQELASVASRGPNVTSRGASRGPLVDDETDNRCI